MRARIHPSRSAAGGFSYVEVLLAVILVAVTLVPALQALRIGITGAKTGLDMTASARALGNKMEELLARPYADLLGAAAATGNSSSTPVAAFDPNATLAYPLPAVAPAGPGFTDTSFNVYVTMVDPATGLPTAGVSPDLGLLLVRVSSPSSGQELVAYRARVELTD